MNAPLASIRDDLPTDQGGPLARKGFDFQDHIAAKCCLEMLEGSDISEVWCETYDDIVNLKAGLNGSSDEVEYIQVKSLEIDQLWSVARLCQRESGRIGTSLLEQSYARDRFREKATFRLVTSLPVNNELGLLRLALNHHDRAICTPAFGTLTQEVEKRFAGTCLAPGTDAVHWLSRAVWQNFSPKSISEENIGKMHSVLDSLGYSPDSNTCRDVYQQLLTAVKDAASLPWADRQNRKFGRQRTVDLLRSWIDPHPNVGSTIKLTNKILATSLDASYPPTAVGLRNSFRRRFRDSRVMEELNRSDLESTVLSRLHNLRLQLDSGELNDTPAQFYSRCVREMQGLQTERRFEKLNLPEGFFEGCMYEITGRCAHRFVKGGQ